MANGRRRMARGQPQAFTINLGGPQTADVPQQLLTIPLFDKVINLFYDKQGSVTNKHRAEQIASAKLVGDKPLNLFTYQNQLLCAGKKGIYRFDRRIRNLERFSEVGTRTASGVSGTASRPIYSQTNISLDIDPIAKKETDILFPTVAYKGHAHNKDGQKLPNFDRGPYCLVAGYDVIAKAIIIREYDMDERKITATSTLDINNDLKIPFCQGLDLCYYEGGGSDGPELGAGYYLCMFYKGEDRNQYGNAKVFRLDLEETAQGRRINLTSAQDFRRKAYANDTIFAKLWGDRVYHFTKNNLNPNELTMGSDIWFETIPQGNPAPVDINLNSLNLLSYDIYTHRLSSQSPLLWVSWADRQRQLTLINPPNPFDPPPGALIPANTWYIGYSGSRDPASLVIATEDGSQTKTYPLTQDSTDPAIYKAPVESNAVFQASSSKLLWKANIIFRDGTAYNTSEANQRSVTGTHIPKSQAEILGGIPDQGPTNVARLHDGKTLYDFRPWLRKRQPSAGIEGIPRDNFFVMWAPQVGYFITNINSEILAHFHADRTPLEPEDTDNKNGIPKMSYSGGSIVYYKPDPIMGTHVRKLDAQGIPTDKLEEDLPFRKSGQRFTPIWVFPILSSGQTETEVSSIEDVEENTDNLLVPTQYTGVTRPLGIELVQACFGCSKPQAKEINNQMIIGGGTLNYYDGVRMVERGFAERPKLEVVQNPSKWEHDTSNFTDVSAQIDQIPDEDKSQVQYTSARKRSLYTESIVNDPTKQWRVRVRSTSAKWTATKTGTKRINGVNTTDFNALPKLKLPNGNDTTIDIDSLEYDPNAGAPLSNTSGYKAVILKLSGYTSAKLSGNILPRVIVINARPYRFQSEAIAGGAVTLTAYTKINPFAGFALDAQVPLFIPLTSEYEPNTSLTEVLSEDIDGKQVTLTNSIYQKAIEKRKTSNVEGEDTPARLLQELMITTYKGIFIREQVAFSGVIFVVYLSILISQTDSNGLTDVLDSIDNDIRRQSITDGILASIRKGDDLSVFTNPDLTQGNGNGGKFIGFIDHIFSDASGVQFFIVIDEGANDADFKKWIADNNIDKLEVTFERAETLTFTASQINSAGSYGNSNRYKVYKLGDTYSYNFYGPTVATGFKFYTGQTTSTTTTQETDVEVSGGAFYIQKYRNDSARTTQLADLTSTDIFDNFDLSDVDDASTIRMPRDSFLKFGAGQTAVYEKTAQVPIGWLESPTEKLINLLYIKTQVVTSTLQHLLKASIYKYVCRFKWVDELGNEHRSQWSSPVQVITGPREGRKSRIIVGRLKQELGNFKTADAQNPDNWETIYVGASSALARAPTEVLKTAPVVLKCNFLHFSKKRNVAIELYRTWDLSDTYRQVKLESGQNNTPDSGLALRNGEILNGPYVRGVRATGLNQSELDKGNVEFADQTENPLRRDITFRDTLRDNQLGQIIHPNNVVVNGAEKIEVYNERFVVYGFPASRNKVIVSSPVDPTKNFGAQFLETNQASTRYYELTFNEEVLRCQAMDDKLIIFTSKKIYVWVANKHGTGGPKEVTNAAGFRLRHKEDPVISYTRGLMFITDQNRAVTLNTGMTTKIHSEINLDELAIQRGHDIGWNRVIDQAKPANTYEVALLLRSGHVLIYNYRLDRWCQIEEGPLPASGQKAFASNIVSIAYWKQNPTSTAKLIYITEDGTLGEIKERSIRDDQSSRRSASAEWSSIETGEWQLASIANYQRVKDFWLIGSFVGLEELHADLWFNGAKDTADPNPVPHQTITAYKKGHLKAIKRPDQKKAWRFKPSVQKCDSIRIKFRIKSKQTELSAIKFTAVILSEVPVAQ